MIVYTYMYVYCMYLYYVHVYTWVHVITCASVHVCVQSALGWDYQAELAKHGSQTDASKGFGGKYGVQKDLKDKVCDHCSL